MALMRCGRAALVSRCQRGQSPWAEGVNTNWATLGSLRRLISSWARVMISSLSSSLKHDATCPLCANERILDRKSDALDRHTASYTFEKVFPLVYFPNCSITITTPPPKEVSSLTLTSVSLQNKPALFIYAYTSMCTLGAF